MGISSSLSKAAFCLRLARTPGTFLQLVIQSRAAQGGTARAAGFKNRPTEYLLKLANAPNPTTLRTNAGDFSILYEIFWQQAYHLPQLQGGVFRTVIDVGANVGLAALYFLEKFPVTRLVCVEPEPVNFQILQSNLRGTLAVGVQAALAATDGMVKIDSSPQAYNARVSADAGTIEVAAISMPSLLHLHQMAWVDLLKIDIEDYEQQVFVGDCAWLAQISTLVIEIHSPTSQQVVRRAVQAQGFSWEQAAGKQPDTGLFVARNPRWSPGNQ